MNDNKNANCNNNNTNTINDNNAILILQGYNNTTIIPYKALCYKLGILLATTEAVMIECLTRFKRCQDITWVLQGKTFYIRRNILFLRQIFLYFTDLDSTICVDRYEQIIRYCIKLKRYNFIQLFLIVRKFHKQLQIFTNINLWLK